MREDASFFQILAWRPKNPPSGELSQFGLDWLILQSFLAGGFYDLHTKYILNPDASFFNLGRSLWKFYPFYFKFTGRTVNKLHNKNPQQLFGTPYSKENEITHTFCTPGSDNCFDNRCISGWLQWRYVNSIVICSKIAKIEDI